MENFVRWRNCPNNRNIHNVHCGFVTCGCKNMHCGYVRHKATHTHRAGTHIHTPTHTYIHIRTYIHTHIHTCMHCGVEQKTYAVMWWGNKLTGTKISAGFVRGVDGVVSAVLSCGGRGMWVAVYKQPSPCSLHFCWSELGGGRHPPRPRTGPSWGSHRTQLSPPSESAAYATRPLFSAISTVVKVCTTSASTSGTSARGAITTGGCHSHECLMVLRMKPTADETGKWVRTESIAFRLPNAPQQLNGTNFWICDNIRLSVQPVLQLIHLWLFMITLQKGPFQLVISVPHSSRTVICFP